MGVRSAAEKTADGVNDDQLAIGQLCQGRFDGIYVGQGNQPVVVSFAIDFAHGRQQMDAPHVGTSVLPTGTSRELRFIDGISEGLREAMQRHPQLILMGQDIADYGGVFKITQGFTDLFGKERVRNTPLCESAIVGISLGLSLKGIKSMVEMQFADFVTCGFNQIVNNLAKLHWRWGQVADVVVRMPTGGGTGAGPFHSQSNEAWFTHVPGLKVVYPSTPYDAKGLLLASFEDPNPVLYFEHKGMYRSESGPVPDGFYTVEIGKARKVRDGNAVSILTYGLGCRWAQQVAEEMALDADIIDLPMEVVSTPREMREAVAKMSQLDLILLDTAGRSPKDEVQIQELRAFLTEAQADEVHLVMSSVCSSSTLLKTAERFGEVGATSLLITKLDEASSFGSLWPLLRSCPLPLSYLTDGQNVPDDIQPADRRRLARLVLGQMDEAMV